MNDVQFYSTVLHCKATLYWRQAGLMTWISVGIIPRVQDRWVNLFTYSSALYNCAATAPVLEIQQMIPCEQNPLPHNSVRNSRSRCSAIGKIKYKSWSITCNFQTSLTEFWKDVQSLHMSFWVEYFSKQTRVYSWIRICKLCPGTCSHAVALITH